jgi:hypothetical protein
LAAGVGDDPVRASDQPFDEFIELVMNHIVVRTLACVPQIKPRDQRVAGGEDHQPRGPSELVPGNPVQIDSGLRAGWR